VANQSRLATQEAVITVTGILQPFSLDAGNDKQLKLLPLAQKLLPSFP